MEQKLTVAELRYVEGFLARLAEDAPAVRVENGEVVYDNADAFSDFMELLRDEAEYDYGMRQVTIGRRLVEKLES